MTGCDADVGQCRVEIGVRKRPAGASSNGSVQHFIRWKLTENKKGNFGIENLQPMLMSSCPHCTCCKSMSKYQTVHLHGLLLDGVRRTWVPFLQFNNIGVFVQFHHFLRHSNSPI